MTSEAIAPDQHTARPPGRWQAPTACAAAVLAAIVAYWPPLTLHAGYLWDDVETIRGRPAYSRWANARYLLSREYFDRFAELSYRPVSSFTYFIDRSLYGDKPWGYHLTQLALHAGCSLLVCLLALKLLGRPLWAGFAGILFAVHPIHAEAVNVLAFREDLLAALFAVASFLVFISASRRGRTGATRACLLAAAAMLFALAVFAKESAAPLPALLMVWALCKPTGQGDQQRPARSTLLGTLPHWVVLLFYLGVRFVVLKNTQEETVQLLGGSFGTALLGAASTLAGNTWLILFPRHLSVEYGVSTGASASMVVGMLLLAAGVAAIALAWRRAPAIALGLAWLLLMLAPVSNLVPIANAMADRYLYLPSVGALLALVALCPRARRLVPYGCVLLMGAAAMLAMLTVQRCAQWSRSSAEEVWRQALMANPKGASIRATLAGFYAGRGQVRNAARQQQKVYELGAASQRGVDPADSAPLLYNLGYGKMLAGDSTGAREAFHQALDASPGYAQAIHGLAMLDLQAGAYRMAEERLQQLQRLHPDFLDAYRTLADVYRAQGKLQAAIVQYHQALALEPNNKDLLTRLGMTHIDAKEADSALRVFEALAAKHPRDAQTAYLLGAAHDAKGDLDAALQQYARATTLNPRYAAAHSSIGGVYYRRGRYQDAIREFNLAARYDRKSDVPHINLGRCYRALGDRQSALDHLQQALRLATPGSARTRLIRAEIRRLQELRPTE